MHHDQLDTVETALEQHAQGEVLERTYRISIITLPIIILVVLISSLAAFHQKTVWAAATHNATVQDNVDEQTDSYPLTDTLTIRPLSDIYTDGPPEVINITTTRATLSFISSIPVVCSVIYGTDANYGMIAIDQNMNGGAITEHFPLMAGLEPDTEYSYRVQGTDANGILYVSEPVTFTTPAASNTADAEVNVASLAAGAQVIAVSSNFGGAANDGAWGANSAIDDNPGTAWSSSGDGNDAYIEFQLAEAAMPHAVDVWTRMMSNGTAQIFDFTLTANPGTMMSETFGPFTLPDATKSYRFDIEPMHSIRTIRLDVVDSNGGNTGLVEFGLYDAPPTVAATTTNRSFLYLPFNLR